MTQQSQGQHNWLDRIIAEQNAIASVLYGNPKAVSIAAQAYDYFSEDELEQATVSNANAHGRH